MSTLFIEHHLPAEIVPITFEGGNYSIVHESAAPDELGWQAFDIDQIPNLFASHDFLQFNNQFGGTGRTMAVADFSYAPCVVKGNIQSIRVAGTGDVIDPDTFTGQSFIGASNTFDGTGSAFIAFRTAMGNVGWWKLFFAADGKYTGPIHYTGGLMGTEAEAVVISDGSCCDCVFKIGDVNQDGTVDLLDIDPFVNLISTGQFACEADANEDAVVDLLDVAPFIQILAGG